MLTLLTGLAAGTLHVVVSPDHVAVLAPFSVEAGPGAWRVGLRWGIGHALGLVAVAALAWLLRDAFDPEWLHGASAPLIGLVLVAVGGWGVLHARSMELAGHSGAGAHVHTTAALCVGVLHGVAGTGGVLAVVPVLGMDSAPVAGAYLGGFGAGTLATMVAVAALLGRIAPAERGPAYRRWFLGASAIALLLGLTWLVLAAFGVDVHPHRS